MKRVKAMGILAAVLCLAAGAAGIAGCSQKQDEIIIYTNADDEAVMSMKAALDNNGYENQYIFQTFGTSELGGKLLAEGRNIEADMVTMSTYYIDEAQTQNTMFRPLGFSRETYEIFSDYCAPITSQEGAVIINTEELQNAGLPAPESLKALADPMYAGLISVTDVSSSSTAWLLIQGLISEYGEAEAGTILAAIYDNADVHIEDSGSGPLKKVRNGEVAIGFGLRHQAVAQKREGIPIDYVDPTEGNFSLTESIAVVDKGEQTNPLAEAMAECIIKNGRPALMEHYPNPIYVGEQAAAENISAYPMVYPEPLTVALLKKHQNLSENCK